MTEGGITGKGFVKGDPRINRKGRPRSFDAFRELAQAISHEEAKAAGGQLVINNHVRCRRQAKWQRVAAGVALVDLCVVSYLRRGEVA